MSTVDSCPLYGSKQGMIAGKTIYGYDVCKRCRGRFANRRQIAYAIDTGIVWFFSRIAWRFLLGIVISIDFTWWTAASILMALVSWAAIILKDGLGGKSPGKALMGVQAVDAVTGKPIGLGASFKRNLPVLIPLFWIVIAVQLAKGCRTGDGWANSKVIWLKYANSPVFGGQLALEGFGPISVSLPPVVESNNPFQAPRH